MDKADTKQTWIDWGCETAALHSNTTFLHKHCCLDQWATGFSHSDIEPRSSIEYYCFHATSDAGSCKVTLHNGNYLHKGGIVLAQRYNLWKDVFTTVNARNGHLLFEDARLEGLVVPEDLLENWESSNSRTGRRRAFNSERDADLEMNYLGNITLADLPSIKHISR